MVWSLEIYFCVYNSMVVCLDEMLVLFYFQSQIEYNSMLQLHQLSEILILNNRIHILHLWISWDKFLD